MSRPGIPEPFWSALDRLDARGPLRKRLSALWLERARAEHASVASFDRFALGLLAVAAPPELLTEAHLAAIDEIEHAQLCFALAGAYAGEALGPGPLDLRGTLDTGFDWNELCEGTVLEGCIGETLAAIEAQRCAELCRDEAARIALDKISADEARHSDLAWAFVRWAAEIQPEVRPVLRRAFAAGTREDALGPARFACQEPDVQSHGFLAADEAQRVRRQALTEVLRPAAAALGML